MQQSEQVALSSEDSEDTNQGGEVRYEDILSTKSLQEALAGKSGSPLEARFAQEFAGKSNLLVEYDRDTHHVGKSLLLVIADQAKSDDRVLVITPSTQDVEDLLTEVHGLPITLALPSGVTPRGDSAITVQDDAAVIITDFENAQEYDLKAHNAGTLVFLGFSAGAKIPGSDAFESYLEGITDTRLCFCSESVPLTLNAAVNRHIKTEGCTQVNLEKEKEVQLLHEYYEVGTELLAKPEALATILESESVVRAIIFCNAPSDTDLLEVMLNKKGLKAKKMIGNVPDRAIHSTMDRVQEGEINILILTDISGRGFPVEEFDMIVHYSSPEDPEIYLHRFGQPDGSSRLKRVVSLVGTMDLGNFHFLKKVVEFDFQQQSLPSDEEIAKARFDRFHEEATAFSTEDGELLEYAKLIEESENRQAFILFLLDKALRKLPELESQKGGRKRRRGRDDSRDDDRGSYDDDDRRSQRGNRGDRRERSSREREERPKPRPTRKDIRFYVGHGLSNGLTEDKFVELVKEVMGDEAPELKRSCLRDKYSFFDFERSDADTVFEAMQEAKFSGEEIIFQKAAVLSVPLEEEELEQENEEDTSSNEESEEKSTDEEETE
jgi:superfamily II DNA/RNA helicase